MCIRDRYVFASTKTVRSQTGISANPVSLAFVAVSLLKHIFAEPALLSVLVIGASATTELVLRYLTHDGLTQLTVANRTLAKAEALAHRFGGRATTLHELPECLPKAD